MDRKTSPGPRPGPDAQGRDALYHEGRGTGAQADDVAAMRMLLDLAGVAMVAIDTAGRVTMINKRGCDLLGFPASEVIGKNWMESFVPDADREAVDGLFNRLARGESGPGNRHENRVRTRTGDERTLVWNNATIWDHDGRPVGVLASGEDVTDYERLIDELEASQERLRILFEFAPDGCYVFDDTGRFVDGNQAAERLAGCSRDQIIGKTIEESGLLAAPELPIALRLLEQAFVEPVGPAEFQLQRRGGGSVPIEVRSYPVTIKERRHILAIARDISERRDSQLQLLQVFKETVGVISRTIETRDPYTAGHQQRVAQLATAIGREMGLDPDRLEGLHFGALIHDIGKIYVPAELLNRPGRLSLPEFELIKTHCTVGYNIVKDVKFPWPVAEMILQHHERPDGSGYPAGIRGSGIILEARILAVADVVEAMSSHRPYRPSLGLHLALEEIEKGKGTHYDPEVVQACLGLMRDERFVFDDHRPA